MNSCLVQLWQAHEVARCPRSSSTVNGRRCCDCAPLYAFSGLSTKASITISICVRSVCVACENGSEKAIQTENQFTYMVGPTELERERVYHFLNLQLLPCQDQKMRRERK